MLESTKVLTQDKDTPIVSLDNWMEYARVDSDWDSLVVQDCIDGAVDWAEQYLNRKLFPTTMVGSMKNWNGEFRLPYPPLKEVTRVSAKTPSGEDVEITDFTFNVVSEKINIPSTYCEHTDFLVYFSCGYQSVDEVPSAIKSGIRQFTANLYEQRSDQVAGVSLSSTAMKATRIMKPHRVRSV